MNHDRRIGRRGFIKLSAAITAPIALDRVVGRSGDVAEHSRDAGPESATIVGPVPLASPVRGLRLSRENEQPVPTREEAIDEFRQQVRAARKANVDVIIVPIATTEHLEQAYENHLVAYEFVRAIEDEAFVVRGPADIGRAVEGDRVGLIFQCQGMAMVGTDVSSVSRWSAAGVSIMTLTHFWKTPYGYGAFARRDLGLTPRGEQAIRAMEKAGVILDLSGVGTVTARDALEVASKPVVFSRSNAAGVYDHALNIDDSLIRACADSGGVVGVTAFPPQLSASSSPSTESLVDHIDHMANLVGAEHLALGLDFTDRSRKRFSSDPIPELPFNYPQQLRGFAGLDRLRKLLRNRGYSDDQLATIFGGSLARVLGEVRVAGTNGKGMLTTSTPAAG